MCLRPSTLNPCLESRSVVVHRFGDVCRSCSLRIRSGEKRQRTASTPNRFASHGTFWSAVVPTAFACLSQGVEVTPRAPLSTPRPQLLEGRMNPGLPPGLLCNALSALRNVRIPDPGRLPVLLCCARSVETVPYPEVSGRLDTITKREAQN